MFKSVIGSLNGNSDGRQHTAAADAEEQCESGRAAQAAPKKGRRKRFTASMMNKIHRVATIGGGGGVGGVVGRKSPSMSDDNLGGGKELVASKGAYEAEEEEEDDAYKTAEEACRKMSLSSEPSGGVPGAKYDAPTSKRQMEQHKQQTQQQQRPSLAGSEKFLLPEELEDIPTFLRTQTCDRQLIDDTRRLLQERYARNPENFYDADYERMLTDDWTVSRFLLRRRLDPRRTAKLMEECGRFRKQYKMSEVELWEFPVEFHKAGGLFQYARDRVGNVTMYMRVKMYRRVPEISDVFKAFILCVLERCDVANNGRGTAVIFDLSGCGLQNVDLGFLSWLLSSFRNYCPKGVSYILVYNLPWILNATCKLAMTWMSASNKRAMRFVYGAEIENFIARENLPDYMGGQCKLNYRRVPAGALPATEVCHRFDLTPAQANKIADLFREYIEGPEAAGLVEYERPEECEGEGARLEERLRKQQEKIKVDANLVAPVLKKKKSAFLSFGTSTQSSDDDDEAADEALAAEQEEEEEEVEPSRTLDLVSQATKFIAH